VRPEQNLVITSSQNARVKAARALQNGQQRRKQGLLLIESPKHIIEAINSGAIVQQLFYDPKQLPPQGSIVLSQLDSSQTELIPVSAGVLVTLADTVTPQGMVAVAEFPIQTDIASLASESLLLVADEVRDPGNLGTMLRTAAAVEAGVILCAGCADHSSPKVVRSSAGALYALKICAGLPASTVAKQLQEAGWRTYVCIGDGAQVYYSVDLREKMALVVGNEGYGPAPCWHEYSSGTISIPMPGRVESLNAAVAVAVVLYEALRQRQMGMIT
jgi:TrmH family RNA methyltransferase